MIANFNENPSSNKCQLNSMIQKANRRVKSKRSKTSKSKGSRKMKSRENLEQKKNKRSYQVFSIVKGIYSRT